MDNKILESCIDAIMDEKSIGYSYVQSLVEILWKHNEELNIRDYSVIWRINFKENLDIKYFCYSSNKNIDYSKLDIDVLMHQSNICTLENCHGGIAIPINGNVENPSFFTTYGIVILFSRGGTLGIDKEHLTLFHHLLNKRIPNVMCEDSVINAFQIITNAENINYDEFTTCFGHIGISLEQVANKTTNNKECGLRHFSLWNYILASEKLKMKQFSRNIYSEQAHSNAHTLLRKDEGHFINRAFEAYQMSDKAQILRCFSYNEAKDSFIDEEYFINIALNEENTTIVVAANGESDSGEPDRILNYYVTNIVYTPFISKSFVMTLTQRITNSINKSLVTCRDKVISSLINESMNIPNEQQFYNDVKSIIKDANEADDVLIYLKEGDIFEQKPNANSFTYDDNIVLPEEYAEDNAFTDWLKQVLAEKASDSFYINGRQDCIVYSSLFMCTTNERTEKECIIILINERHKPSKPCVYYNNVFDKDNYYITEKCGSFLIHYQNMQDSINSKNYLLHKLRHEIPSCTDAIDQGVCEIKDALKKDAFSHNYLQTILRNMTLNNSRVLLLAKFFSTVGFDNERFVKDKIAVNLRTFLSSYIETFREEGKYKCVDVYFELIGCEEAIVYVSNYFQLALVNVVTNAIRYAANGTCVFIGVHPDKIEVRDIGIGIKDKEKVLIFKEGYRGNEARRINEKGMGYGLYLTERVLDAHNMEIKVSSQLYFKENYFAQAAVNRYLNSISMKEREDFIYKDLDNVNKDYAKKIYNRIKENSRIVDDEDLYGNLKLDTVKFWLSYISEHNCVFYDMEDIFDESVYEVIFTIYL